MILNRQHTVRVPVAGLEAFLARVKRALRVRRDVTVCLVDDREIRRLNRTFRGKDKATDVLSFTFTKDIAASFPTGGENDYLGDIAISLATARRNARRSGRAFHAELDRKSVV